MNQLTKYLVDGILNEGDESLDTVALFGGGFKPPTKGHLEVVLQGLKENPQVKQVQILVGSGERNGVTQEEAVKIWEMYKKLIPVSTQIVKVQSPFSYIKTYLQDHQDEDVYIFIGARPDNEEDDKDVAERSTYAKKYSEKAIPVRVQTTGGVSGTMARKAALSGNNEEFITYFPKQLTDSEKEEIIQMISSVINELKLPNVSDIKKKFKIFLEKLKQEGKETKDAFSLLIKAAKGEIELTNLDKQQIKEQLKDILKGVFGAAIFAIPAGSLVLLLLKLIKLSNIVTPTAFLEENNPEDGKAAPYGSGYNKLNENASYSKDIDIKGRIMQLTQHMLDKGYNIEPLPTVEFVDGDSDNAREFLGKTAYYNPESQTIVLYTEGRHPKDIVRSFAHEMIHHIQNLEGRLGNITTTNTQEDDHLNDIEAEANLKGTMTFRNWTDSLNEVQTPAKEEDVNPKELKMGIEVEMEHTNSQAKAKVIALQHLAEDPKYYTKLKSLGLEETVVGDKVECDGCGWSWKIADGGDDLFMCHKCGHDNSPLNEAKPYKHKHGFDDKLGKDPFGLNQFAREIAEEVISEGRYDTLANKLSSIAFEAFKDIHDRGDKEGEFEFRVDHPDDEHDIPSKDFYFDFVGKVEITDDEYGVDGGANAGFDKDGNEITPLLSVKFKIPKNPDWQKVSFDIKDVVRHELEHLTQDGDNIRSGKYMEDDQMLRDLIDLDLLPKADYFRLEKEVDAMLQGLYFKAKKSKRPFKDVVNTYLDIFTSQETITQEEKENILDIWRSRAKALSLPVFEQENMGNKYKIYLDMDGVIVDFNKRFTELAGMGPREYESTFGKEKFWDFIDSKEKGGGVGFWVGMDWMPGGEALYNRVAQHNHALLSSPSRSESSRIGKHQWKKKYTPSTKLILALAKNKQNYADGNNILIDDRESNIQQWREAGGIGILYKSASQVNKELDKLGL